MDPVKHTVSIVRLGQHSFLRALVCVSLATLSLFGCGTSKPDPAPLANIKQELALMPIWNVRPSKPLTSPISVFPKQNLLFAVQSNEVVAYNAQTGAVVWRAPGLGLVEAPIALSQDGKSALALVQGKEAVNLDASTGQIVWRAVLPAEMNLPAVSQNGVFVVLTADGRVVGIEEDSGRRRWSFNRIVPQLSLRGSGAIVAGSGGEVVLGLPGGKAFAVRASSGQIIWEALLAEPRGVNEVERIADVLGDWVISPGLGFCATAHRHRMACLNKEGKLTYSQDFNAASALSMLESPAVFVAIDEKGDLRAWDRSAATGAAAKWVNEGLRYRLGTLTNNIAGQGDAVFVSDDKGLIHGFSAQSGFPIMRYQTLDKLGAQLWTGAVAERATLYARTPNSISAWAIAATK